MDNLLRLRSRGIGKHQMYLTSKCPRQRRELSTSVLVHCLENFADFREQESKVDVLSYVLYVILAHRLIRLNVQHCVFYTSMKFFVESLTLQNYEKSLNRQIFLGVSFMSKDERIKRIIFALLYG